MKSDLVDIEAKFVAQTDKAICVRLDFGIRNSTSAIEDSCFRVIPKQLQKQRPFGQRTKSHDDRSTVVGLGPASARERRCWPDYNTQPRGG